MGQRGKTPLTEAMFYVLMAFRRGELCGTEIAAAVERRTEGRVRLGPGTLYGILTRMHTEGYIRLESAEGRRKVYAITEAGTQALLEEYRRLKTMVQDGNILEEELK